MKPSCGSCLHWNPEIASKAKAHLGECRAHSPQFRPSDSQPRWPETQSTDWCGDYLYDGEARDGA